MIDPRIIDDILAVVKIKDVVEDYIPLKKQGSSWVGLCPWHDDRKPSFSVSESRNVYSCFPCQKSGGAVQFLMEQGLKYPDAIKHLGNKYHIEVIENKPREYKRPAEVKTPISQKAVDWFSSRKISKHTLDKFKIRSAMEYMPQKQKEASCILFSYYRDGEVVNIKYRDAEKNFKLVSGAELIFYNLDAIKNADECVIVEGEIDCLSVDEAGETRVVSVPNGAAKGSQRLEYLDNCFEYFVNKKRVVIATDNDSPGIALRDELARRIGYEKCWFINYPAGCKDTNEVKVKHGDKAVMDCLANAYQPPISGIVTVRDVEAKLANLYKNGYPETEGIGIYDIDRHIRFAPGRVTTVTGIPGHGKSDMIDFINVKLSNRRGWKNAYFSPERMPPELHISKLCCLYVGKPFINYDGLKKMDIQEFEMAKEWVNDNFYFFNTDEIDCTMDGILKKATELVQRYGVNNLVIDPYNYVESQKPNGMSDTDYVSLIYNKMRVFAYRYGCHVFFVAHPYKMDKEGNKFKIPNMYSISGSANFYNKTDNGITVYKHDDTGMVEVHIQKIKYFWEGEKGVAVFKYDRPTANYATQMGEFEAEYRWRAMQPQVYQEPISFDQPVQHEAWMDVIPENEVNF